jgi:16S rRNA (cytidine1402-2'-O)-methyltransferase
LNSGKLFLVSTPIGNYDDITLRALKILQEVDYIICEEYKIAKRLLSYYKIEKELLQVNEHNEKENSNEIINLLKNGRNLALISDCGTPLFSDPGNYLVTLALNNNIRVIPIPGANSVIQALSGAGFKINKFYFFGWLSAKNEMRKNELKKISKIKDVIVLMETPYRLQKLLSEISQNFHPNTYVVLAYELTKENEFYFRGTINEIYKIATEKNLKGEFVLIIDNRGNK